MPSPPQVKAPMHPVMHRGFSSLHGLSFMRTASGGSLRQRRRQLHADKDREMVRRSSRPVAVMVHHRRHGQPLHDEERRRLQRHAPAALQEVARRVHLLMSRGEVSGTRSSPDTGRHAVPAASQSPDASCDASGLFVAARPELHADRKRRVTPTAASPASRGQRPGNGPTEFAPCSGRRRPRAGRPPT